jgi:hypothetical protein
MKQLLVEPAQVKKKEKKLVAVTWHDSFIQGEWAEYEAPKPTDSLVTTYGLLVAKDRQWLTLAMTFVAGKVPYWGCLWSIPRRNILSIREIENVPDKPEAKREVLDGHRN